MPGVLRGGSMGCFGVGHHKMQTTDCCRPLFSPRNQKRDKNSPTDCFLTLKTMVCMIQSAVCILYSPVLEWTGTLVRKCVHKQSYINITGMVVSTKFLQTQESLPLIYLALQRLGQQTSCKLNDL